MKNIYVKKIVSLHPSVFEYKKLDEMIERYGDYCYLCGESSRFLDNAVKTFKEWLRTEI